MSNKKCISLIGLFIIYLCNLPVFGQQHLLTQLTFSDSTHDGYPYWSPDGHTIIYSSGTATNCRAMRITSTGGIPEPITDGFAQHARWSPDGDYIAFDGDRGTSLKMIPSSGGNPVRIDPDTISIRRSGMPCWSPDGSMIAFRSQNSIYVMNLNTRSLYILFTREGKLAVPFDWSSDGLRILADVRDEKDPSLSDIWEVPLQGLPRQITFLPGRQVKPAYSPDGSMILFTSDHVGEPGLWILPARGGEPVRIFSGGMEGSWSPDGSSIAFTGTRGGRWAIMRMDLDMNYLRELIPEPVRYTEWLPTIDTGTIPVFPFILDRVPDQMSPGSSWDFRELVLVHLEDGLFAWVDATVEKKDSMNYPEGMFGAGNQVFVDGSDFTSLAGKGIHSEEELRNTRTITGRSVSHITIDGRPGASSGSGFMAEDETILSVILADNRIVQRLGLTHPDLSRPLFHLWNISKFGERYNANAPTDEEFSLQGLQYRGRIVDVKVSGSRGWQESIFNDGIYGSWQIEAWRELDPGEEQFLKTHYGQLTQDQYQTLIQKLSRIHTGEMVPFYISRYGFYEGHTDYRAEPLALAFIFGIRTLEEIHEASGGDLFSYLTGHFTLNP